MRLIPPQPIAQNCRPRHPISGAAAIAAAVLCILQPSRAKADTAPITACDTAASFAFDNQRAAPGVSYGAINAPVAIAQCAQAVRIYPTSGRLQFELGRALEKAGKLRQAIAAYQRAAELGHGGGFNNLGELYRSGKGVPLNLTFAQREFEQGAARNYPEAQFNLATLLLSQGRTDANIVRARWLLTSAYNAGYTDALGPLHALSSPTNDSQPSGRNQLSSSLARAAGPSFDCSKIGRDGLSTIICSSPELSAQNLLLGQAYYALRHQVGAGGHDTLKAEARASNIAMKQHCAVPGTTPLPFPAQSYVPCVQSETNRIRGSWIARLTNEDLEEAKRPIEQLIAAQQELIRQGLLPKGTNADGVFRDATREALSSWQAANSIPATGALDNKTAALLLKQPGALTTPLVIEAPKQLPVAPAPEAQADIPLASSALSRVFTPKMLGIQVPFLETIVGPAMRLTKLQHDLALRTYQVGNCELLAYSQDNTISAYGLRLKTGCAADVSQFLGQAVSVTADSTFGSVADTLGGATGTYQSACIYDCGNATDSRVEWTWQGSHAQNFIKVQLVVTLVAPDAIKGMVAWQNAMFQSQSHEYVSSGHFNCDGRYQDAASNAFSPVRVTELFIGHGESIDDQDVAMTCPPSGGFSNASSVAVQAPSTVPVVPSAPVSEATSTQPASDAASPPQVNAGSTDDTISATTWLLGGGLSVGALAILLWVIARATQRRRSAAQPVNALSEKAPMITVIPRFKVAMTGKGAPLSTWKLVLITIFFGACAAFATPTNVSTISFGDGFGALCVWLLFLACISLIILRFMPLKDSPYIPGKSLNQFRKNDEDIAKQYRSYLRLGLGVIAIAVLGFIFTRQPRICGTLLSGGIGLAVLGRLGRISQAVHADVDHVAAETLRRASLLTSEVIYSSYQNFDSSKQTHGKPGDFILGVFADGFVLLFMQKQGWEKVRRKFSDVRAIGITTASEGGMFNRSEMVINLVLRFADAAEYRIKLDPERKVTTEPLTFTRQFLRSLDNSLSGLDFGQPASPRKRRVVEGVLASPNADPLVLETSDPVGAAMTTNERHLELDGALATELQSVASAPPGRSLEL